MLKLFRGIRQKLLSEGKTGKYLKYAIGEILLVVVGILIALQINIWNEEQKAIKAKHEKYRAIILDLQRDIGRQALFRYASEQADKKLKRLANESQSDSLSIDQNYMDDVIFILDYHSYVKENHGHLTGEITDNVVSNQLAEYLYWQHGVEKALELQNRYADDIRTYFANEGYLNLESINKVASNEAEAPLVNPAKLQNLIRDEVFQGHIIKYNMVYQRLGEKVLGLIKANQRLQLVLADHIGQPLYKNLGVVGSALADGWDQSLPMSPTKADNNIREIRLDLEDGEVKFRVNNEWTMNWGGNNFPEGKLVINGSNIPVKKGRYLVQVDLNNFSYSFTKVD